MRGPCSLDHGIVKDCGASDNRPSLFQCLSFIATPNHFFFPRNFAETTSVPFFPFLSFGEEETLTLTRRAARSHSLPRSKHPWGGCRAWVSHMVAEAPGGASLISWISFRTSWPRPGCTTQQVNEGVGRVAASPSSSRNHSSSSRQEAEGGSGKWFSPECLVLMEHRSQRRCKLYSFEISAQPFYGERSKRFLIDLLCLFVLFIYLFVYEFLIRRWPEKPWNHLFIFIRTVVLHIQS